MKVTATRGLSLIEILLVIAILGIVLIIAAPNFNSYSHNTNLKSAGRDLAGDILKAKQNAAAQGIHYRIWLSTSGNNYGIVKGDSNGTEGGYDYGNAITKTPSSFAGYITIGSSDYGLDKNNNPQIVFEPRGTTSMGKVILKNDIGSTITIKTTLMGKVSVQ